MTLRLLCLSIVLAICHRSLAVTNNVACTFAAIQAAVQGGADGDVVVIAPGSCTITDHIVWSKAVSLIGSGTNLTTLISEFTDLDYPLQVASTGYGFLTTISDMTMVGGQSNSFGFILTGRNVGAPTTTNGPIRITRITMPSVVYRGISLGGQIQGGCLVDHCWFDCPISGHNEPISYNGNSFWSWTNANPLGTTNVNCVEDCFFNMEANSGNGVFDSYDGSQLVFRHNVLTGSVITGVHGYDSQNTSARTWEIYNNLFTNCNAGLLICELRGGTGCVFSNTVDTGADFCELAYYRSCAFAHAGTVAAYGLADKNSTNQLDGNHLTNTIPQGTEGWEYPCNQQPGIISSTATNAFSGSNVQVVLPAYAWSNLFKGASAAFTLKDDTSACFHQITNLVKEARDFFNNVAMPGYVPMVYPHPLDIPPVIITQLRAHR